MRNLASIQVIKDIVPIEGADRIELAFVEGWQVVVKKDEFEVGEFVIYIEIDSIVPDIPYFDFMAKRKFRVRTIKLRKQLSQGLIVPTNALLKGKLVWEGQDVTNALGIIKYDPEGDKERRMMEQQALQTNSQIKRYLMRSKWYKRIFGKKRSIRAFPTFVHKTDETRCQNIPSMLIKEKDTEFEVTEKLDGQSATFILVKNKKLFGLFGNDYEFMVCSRNLRLPKPNGTSYWTIAKDLEVERVLKSIIGDKKFVCIQGEIIGEGIQKNKYDVKGYEFYAYNLIFPDGKKSHGEMQSIIGADVSLVPLLESAFKLPETVNELLDYSDGQSQLHKTKREGVVIRNYDKGISFKAVSPKFLLKHDL